MLRKILMLFLLFVMSITLYSCGEIGDPTINQELVEYKTSANKIIDEYKDISLYQEEQQSELKSTRAIAKLDIANAIDKDKVDLAVSNGKMAMDQIKTAQEITLEIVEINAVKLENYKNFAKEKLEDFKNFDFSIDENNDLFLDLIRTNILKVENALDIPSIDLIIEETRCTSKELYEDSIKAYKEQLEQINNWNNAKKLAIEEVEEYLNITNEPEDFLILLGVITACKVFIYEAPSINELNLLMEELIKQLKSLAENQIDVIDSYEMNDSSFKQISDNYSKSIGEEDLSIKRNVNVYLNYYTSGNYFGITNQLNSPLTINNKNYFKGDLLPSWEAIGSILNIGFCDVTNYSMYGDGAVFNDVITKGSSADLFANTLTNIEILGLNNKAIPLNQYLGYMPNFAKFLKENHNVANQLRASDGNIYYTPQFDKYNSLEKSFLMNVDFTKALLDDKPEYYTDDKTDKYAPYKSTFDDSTVMNFRYNTPYIPSLENETIRVVNKEQNGSMMLNITIPKGNDIITRFANISVKNGKNLVSEFREYIDEVYGQYIGKDKLYSQRSDIFTSASACYNADELVALLRCVKANPQYLAGINDIIPFSPRTQEANRQHSVQSLMQIWGIRGTDSEKDRLYFDKDGNLQDGRTNVETYSALNNISKLYQEGLILPDYTAGTKTNFAQNLSKAGKWFMGYDYVQTTAMYTESYSGSLYAKTKSSTPILPPVAKWDDGGLVKTKYFHFTEDTNQVKNSGWCILNNTQRSNEELIRVLTLMDSFYDRDQENSKGIADIQDFGPNTSFWRKSKNIIYGNSQYIQVSDDVNNFKLLSGLETITDTYRMLAGSNHKIGCIKSEGLEYQETSLPGRVGLSNLKKAIDLKVLFLANSNGKNFYKAVPQFWHMDNDTILAIDTFVDNTLLNNFWKELGTNTCVYSQVIMYGFGQNGTPTNNQLVNCFSTTDEVYLKYHKEAYQNMQYQVTGRSS